MQKLLMKQPGNRKYEEWTQVENLVLNSGSSDTHYELRLNENILRIKRQEETQKVDSALSDLGLQVII